MIFLKAPDILIELVSVHLKFCEVGKVLFWIQSYVYMLTPSANFNVMCGYLNVEGLHLEKLSNLLLNRLSSTNRITVYGVACTSYPDL